MISRASEKEMMLKASRSELGLHRKVAVPDYNSLAKHMDQDLVRTERRIVSSVKPLRLIVFMVKIEFPMSHDFDEDWSSSKLLKIVPTLLISAFE